MISEENLWSGSSRFTDLRNLIFWSANYINILIITLTHLHIADYINMRFLGDWSLVIFALDELENPHLFGKHFETLF